MNFDQSIIESSVGNGCARTVNVIAENEFYHVPDIPNKPVVIMASGSMIGK